MNEQQKWAEAMKFLERVDAQYEKVLRFFKNVDRAKLSPTEQQKSTKLVQKITRRRSNIARKLQPLRRQADIARKFELLD
jgi:hypothetical protein